VKWFVIVAVLVTAFVTLPKLTRSSATSASAVQSGEFMIVNKTSYTFMKLYLSSSASRSWGPDQLGRKVINPGGSYTLTHIACNLYDVKLVDEDGDECVVEEVPMCKDHTHWEVTNDLLTRCEGYH
jgi:hypothetical protein